MSAACAETMPRENRMTGLELAEILRQDYHLEMEMCGADYVTAITTLMDSREGFDRLETALFAVDGKLAACSKPSELSLSAPDSANLPRTRAILPIHEAQMRPMNILPLESAAGTVSGEYVYLYPPGTPIVVPGEILTKEVIGVIQKYRARQLPIQGLSDHTASAIRVLA